MVQIVENWAEVEGVVTRVGEGDGRPELEIEVESAQEVAGYPNLLADHVGRLITIILADDATELRPEPGDRVRCRVRKAGSERYFGWVVGEPGTE